MKVNSRLSNGRIGKIVEDDGTDMIPIKVEYLDDNGLECCDPEELTDVLKPTPTTQKFRKGDIVRRIDTGRGNSYENFLKIGKIYIVAEDENTNGDVEVRYDGDDCNKLQTVKWYDLELVAEVEDKKFGITEFTHCVQVISNDDNQYIHQIWWKTDAVPNSPYTKQEAIAMANDICDKLNKKEA